MSGCGRAPVVDLGQFAPYVERFENEAKTEGKPVTISDLIVHFGTTDEKQDGVCETGDSISPTIIVNEKAWNKMTENDRESLMFHELGHCVLNRVHLTAKDSKGNPVSIMYPIALSTSLYTENRNRYIHELFYPLGG